MVEIVSKVHSMLEPLIEGTDIFIVNIKVKPVNNIKVFLDSDSGLSIEKCIPVNRKLYAQIEDEGLFPDGDFSLEVSSPGVDEPLGPVRQYKKNIGRKLLIEDKEGTEKIGMLRAVTDEGITLEMPVPKKKETIPVEIPFADIKKAVVQIIF